MPPDLLAVLVLHPQERRDQARVAPVGSRVEDEVRAHQPSLVLEACKVQRSIETLVDVVAKSHDGSFPIDGCTEFTQRHDDKPLRIGELF